MNYDCSNYGATLKDYKPDEIAKYIRLSLADENQKQVMKVRVLLIREG